MRRTLGNTLKHAVSQVNVLEAFVTRTQPVEAPAPVRRTLPNALQLAVCRVDVLEPSRALALLVGATLRVHRTLGNAHLLTAVPGNELQTRIAHALPVTAPLRPCWTLGNTLKHAVSRVDVLKACFALAHSPVRSPRIHRARQSTLQPRELVDRHQSVKAYPAHALA